jgi:hypothetical protein
MFWFDLDNSPHVQIFRPVINNFRKNGTGCLVTARDFAQTKQLLEMYDMPHALIGEYGGKNTIKKIINLYDRSTRLKNFVHGKDISLAVNHGSRSQAVAAKRARIKSVTMVDYEYTEIKIFNYYADYILVPLVIPYHRLKEAGFNMKKVIRYGGMKEDIYLNGFKPDENFREKIGIRDDEILAVLRPPSTTSNYHDPESEYLLVEVIEKILKTKNTKIIAATRMAPDRQIISEKFPGNDRIVFLDKPVDGLQLLYAADLTLSGGGTMNRESSLLGTKTYSFFTGRRPFIDENLANNGMLEFISGDHDIDKIEVKKHSGEKEITVSENTLGEVCEILRAVTK